VSIAFPLPAVHRPHRPVAVVFDRPEPGMVRAGRKYVSGVLARYGADLAALEYDAVLVTSELLSNAVQHGGPRVTLTVRRTRRGVQITVTDRGRHQGPADGRDESEHGRGQGIVRELAVVRTRKRRIQGGRTVRATLNATPNQARGDSVPEILDGTLATLLNGADA